MTVITEFHSSTTSKAVVLIVSSTVVLWIGMILVGLGTGEPIGYVAFGTLVASIGISLATAISLKAPAATFGLARRVWIATAILILLVGVTAARAPDIVVYAMSALAFPVGVVGLPLVGAVAGISGATVGTILIWLFAVVAGYVQWFVLLPRLVRPPRQKNEPTG
jgi:hypothetical protein